MRVRKGFSLLEVIIALSVITVTFVGVTNLVSRNLQSNLMNQSFITAHYLSVEGVEIVRNMRDSNWLQNFSFNANTDQLWGESLWPRGGGKVLVQVDKSVNGDTPWLMRPTGPLFEGNELFLKSDVDGSEFTHTTGGKDTRFARYIELEVAEEAGLDKYDGLTPLKVTAVTMFNLGKREREVRYSTILTDWKQGPL